MSSENIKPWEISMNLIKTLNEEAANQKEEWDKMQNILNDSTKLMQIENSISDLQKMQIAFLKQNLKDTIDFFKNKKREITEEEQAEEKAIMFLKELTKKTIDKIQGTEVKPKSEKRKKKVVINE